MVLLVPWALQGQPEDLLTGHREANYFDRGVTANTKARTLNMRKLNEAQGEIEPKSHTKLQFL